MQLIQHKRLIYAAAISAIMLLLFGYDPCKPVMAADIAAFGDSITEGVGSDTGGYPPKLQDLLNNMADEGHLVDNHGKAGEATALGNGRIHSVLESKPYQYILILEGTNDIFFGISLESTQYYLETMINKARNLYNVTPLISNLTPDTRPTTPANRKRIESTYNPMIAQIAEKLDVPLIDLHSAVVQDWNALSDDQLHPNDKGYQIIAETWFDPLQALIQEAEDQNGDGGCFIKTICP